MQIIEWTNFQEKGLQKKNTFYSVTVGIFDGVHRGHQELIKRVVSHNAGFVPVVVTFRENHKTNNKYLITNDQGEILSFQQRIKLFERFGVKIAVVIDFSEKIRQTSGLDFLNILMEHCNIGFFAVGADFKCGFKLDTDAKAIQKFFVSHDIPSEIVPQVMEGALPVSSSRIRAAIAQGNTTLAQKMLGHDKMEEI